MSSEKEFGYRNKMEFSFSASRWLTPDEIGSEVEIENKNFALGLHVPGRFDKVLNVNNCHIQPESGNRILNLVKEKALKKGIKPYDLKDHIGFLRNLVLRFSLYKNEIMVILVTSSEQSDKNEEFIIELSNLFKEELPEISNFVHAVTDSVAQVAIGKPEIVFGKGYITEKILGVEYRISPFSFFQTNSNQLDKFIGKILEYAGELENKTIWDLYCGTGSISLPAAGMAKKVYGIELVAESIEDAKFNAELNEINNCDFYCADLHDKKNPELMKNFISPDIIIIDPPRAGMHKNLIAHLLEISCARIVYVSCNPATQARDVGLLSEMYNVTKLQPVDMFPHTYHIESIALLEKK